MAVCVYVNETITDWSDGRNWRALDAKPAWRNMVSSSEKV